MSDNNLTPRIEQLAPELEKIISTSAPIEHLADGFGGAQGRPRASPPAPGPAALSGRLARPRLSLSLSTSAHNFALSCSCPSLIGPGAGSDG